MDDADEIAGFKAEKLTTLRFDFDLEDIIAGNTPDGEIGQQLKAIVDSFDTLPTPSRIEAALIPLYETMAADFYREAGGTARPPTANRQSIREHAVKVIQARKVKRTALMRAAKGARTPAGRTSPVTRFQLVGIVVLIVLIAAAFYLKSWS